MKAPAVTQLTPTRELPERPSRADLPVVAWDGEGINTRKDHRYVLLQAGTSGGIVTDRLTDLDGITLRAALDCLAVGLARPGLHVGYATTYDVTMICRKLPRPQLARLHGGKPVSLGIGDAWYRVEWRPRRFLKVWRRAGSLDWVGGTLWDLWSYTQSSFLDACERYGIGTPAELRAIRAGKTARASFTARHLDYMVGYNRVELTLLAQLAERIRTATQRARLYLKRWDGPGPAAAALLSREGVGKRRAAAPPASVERASRHAYYGGRSEVIHYGHSRTTPVAEYDITSAYPSVLADAPCTARGCGHWKFYDAADSIPPTDTAYALHRIRWSGDASRKLHPFPWRAPNGGVFFPASGEGWVWTPELLAGSATHDVELLESWQWVSECKHTAPPYAWVRRIFAEREELARRGDGSEAALKIALNTIYGKFAQRAGTVRITTRDGKPRGWKRPRWYDLCLAGYLTSSIRARMYAAAHPIADRVLLIATDSLIVRDPKPNDVELTAGLGAWTRKRYTGATIVQSGFYWLHTTGGASQAHTRGVDSGTLEWRDIVHAWRDGETHLSALTTRFGSIAQAKSGGKGWRSLGEWRSEGRQIALHPWGTKRVPVVSDTTRRPIVRPDRGFCPTLAVSVERFGRAMTTPIGVPWARESDPELAQ